jgi:hypothetical protein
VVCDCGAGIVVGVGDAAIGGVGLRGLGGAPGVAGPCNQRRTGVLLEATTKGPLRGSSRQTPQRPPRPRTHDVSGHASFSARNGPSPPGKDRRPLANVAQPNQAKASRQPMGLRARSQPLPPYRLG